MDSLAVEIIEEGNIVRKRNQKYKGNSRMLTNLIANAKGMRTIWNTEKFETLKNTFKEIIKKAKKEYHQKTKKGEIQTIENNGFRRFAAIPDLKPVYLEKKAKTAAVKSEKRK